MSVKLYYFDGYGRAEQIRMLLNHAKVPFDDVRIAQAEWPTKKAELNAEFGQVPLLELDGKQYGQTGSILRLLGKQHGYYSEDPITAWKIDTIYDSYNDLAPEFGKIYFAQDEEQKKTQTEKLFKTTLPAWANVIENRLKANSSQKHIVGDSQTVADFVLDGLVFANAYNEKNALQAQVKEVLD